MYATECQFCRYEIKAPRKRGSVECFNKCHTIAYTLLKGENEKKKKLFKNLLKKFATNLWKLKRVLNVKIHHIIEEMAIKFNYKKNTIFDGLLCKTLSTQCRMHFYTITFSDFAFKSVRESVDNSGCYRINWSILMEELLEEIILWHIVNWLTAIWEFN